MLQNNPIILPGSKTPAFIAFMIDQSSSMMNYSLGGGNRAEIAAMNVQNAILGIITRCINGCEVRNAAFITVMGYGGYSTRIIRDGWVEDWVEDTLLAKTNSTCVIPVIAEGIANMDEGFFCVLDLIKEWTSIREEGSNKENYSELGSVVVVNITKGTTVNQEATYEAARELMALQNTLLFNIVIPHDSYKNIEIYFPNTQQTIADTCDPNQPEWLFDISSKLPIQVVGSLKSKGFEDVTEDSRGIILSMSDNIALDIIRLLFPFSDERIEYK